MEDRQSLIEKIQWNNARLFKTGSFMVWALDIPRSGIKSIVVVRGPPDKYTDEELEKIVEFSGKMTTDDIIFCRQRETNLIIIDKNQERTRKRHPWAIGPYFSNTLDEAINIFKERILID
ncbi:MAG: hypothetical protein WC472_04275 [Candidatus Paceibacterota bacterium]